MRNPEQVNAHVVEYPLCECDGRRTTMRVVLTKTPFPTSPFACSSCGRAAGEPCRHGRKGHANVMCSARRLASGTRHDGKPMFDDAFVERMRAATFTAEPSATS